MKTLKQKRFSGFPFKPTALFAALMVVGIPYAQAVTGPFARVPLHLQDVSVLVSEGVKPNVLLQIDDWAYSYSSRKAGAYEAVNQS